MVLELKEFMSGISILFLSRGERRLKLEYVFDLFDSNFDGLLSLREVEDGYRAIYKMLGNHTCDVICKQMAEGLFFIFKFSLVFLIFTIFNKATVRDLGKPDRNSNSIQIKKGNCFYLGNTRNRPLSKKETLIE